MSNQIQEAYELYVVEGMMPGKLMRNLQRMWLQDAGMDVDDPRLDKMADLWGFAIPGSFVIACAVAGVRWVNL